MNPFVVVFNLIQKLFPMKELPEKSELTVEVKTGFYPYQTYLQCSECKYTAPNTYTKWSGCCPECGCAEFSHVIGRWEYEIKHIPYLGAVRKNVKFHKKSPNHD